MSYNLTELLTKAANIKASDVHITVGLPPVYRVNGELSNAGEEILTQEERNG